MPRTSYIYVPCLDSQYDHDAVTRVVRMPFALTRLRPEGKCVDTPPPEVICRGMRRPDAVCLDLSRPEDQYAAHLRLVRICTGGSR
jgi:hypothetical protein